MSGQGGPFLAIHQDLDAIDPREIACEGLDQRSNGELFDQHTRPVPIRESCIQVDYSQARIHNVDLAYLCAWSNGVLRVLLQVGSCDGTQQLLRTFLPSAGQTNAGCLRAHHTGIVHGEVKCDLLGGTCDRWRYSAFICEASFALRFSPSHTPKEESHQQHGHEKNSSCDF